MIKLEFRWCFELRTRGSGVRIPSGALFIKKAPRLPWPRDRKRADRTPDGQQDSSTTRRRTGLTSPLQRRRSGAKRRTRDRRPRSNPSGRAIQISLKAPNRRLDRQLRRASYIAIRQLSNVRPTPQATTLKAFLLPIPRGFTWFSSCTKTRESAWSPWTLAIVGLPNGGNGAAGIARESVVRCCASSCSLIEL